MSPAHQSRERRWLVLILVVAVLAGVAVAARSPGKPAAGGPPPASAAAVGAPDAESSAWYCTGQSTAAGGGPGLLHPDQHPGHAGAGNDQCGDGHRGQGDEPVSVPPGANRSPPSRPCDGSWISEAVVTSRAAAWPSPRPPTARRAGRGPLPEQHVAAVVLPRRGRPGVGRAVRRPLQPDVDARRRRPRIRHADGRRAPHQLPGHRLGARPGAGGERGLLRTGEVERHHRRGPAPAAWWRASSSSCRGTDRDCPSCPGRRAPRAVDHPPEQRGRRVDRRPSTCSTRGRRPRS